MSHQKEDHIKLINANIKDILSDIVLQLDCDPIKKQTLTETLAFLGDIVLVYGSNNQSLMSQTFNRLGQIKHLYQFEIEILVKQLYAKFFSQIHVFREAYQISVLKLDLPKYKHLKVDQPLISITIPRPYLSQPLSEAKFIGQGRVLTFDDDEEPSA